MNNENEIKVNIYDEQYKNLNKQEKNNIDDNMFEDYNNLEWKEYHENILVDWADKAICYKWLHTKSTNKYQTLRNIYTIPVIILSTLTGTANFAIERVPKDYQAYSQIAIGSLNIIAGIISTIAQFLKINELSEAHRVASISWDKFYRNIRVELVKCPEDRMNVGYLIKSCKDEYDRLIETSPIIDQNIINQFNKTFENKKINKLDSKETSNILNKPEILDNLESTKNIVFKYDKNIQVNKDLFNTIKFKKEQIEHENIISNFINTFEKEFSRQPSILEIYDNLDNIITKDKIKKYMDSSKWLNRNK